MTWSGNAPPFLEEEQSYLVTISDLMSGLIFIFLITLMVFALRFQQTTEYTQSAAATRNELLIAIAEELEHRGIKVSIDTAQGIVRLGEDAVSFPIGGEDPYPENLEMVDTLAAVLSAVLPCFVTHRGGLDCRTSADGKTDFAAKIDVLLIEGHTDSRRILSGRFRNNLELSGARAASIKSRLVAFSPRLDSIRNGNGSSIISISGYGAQRLLPSIPDTAEGNRRIDLRFLMEAPSAALDSMPVRAFVREEAIR